jgi:HSP20 family protein
MLWTDIGRYGRRFDPSFDLDWLVNAPGRFLSTAPVTQTNEFPLVNLYADADTVVLTTEIPGIEPSSVEISVAGKAVRLRGARAFKPAKEGETYHRRERWYGRFSKTIELPFNIEAEKVEARFSKGVLRVVLPKAEEDKPKTILVKSE